MNFPRLLALAVLGLVGTLGTAKADVISSDSVAIWSADTPGATSASPTQQGLPSAAAGLTSIIGPTAFSAPINYNLQPGGSNTIGGFFLSNSPLPLNPFPSTCGAGCQGTELSDSSFAHVTLFEFTFHLVDSSELTFIHDDGISLFLDGNSTNLIPGVSSPTVAELTTVTVGPGTYNLWYSASNGLPEVLQASAVVVPGPVVGAGLPGLIAACSGLLALARRRRNKKVA